MEFTLVRKLWILFAGICRDRLPFLPLVDKKAIVKDEFSSQSISHNERSHEHKSTHPEEEAAYRALARAAKRLRQAQEQAGRSSEYRQQKPVADPPKDDSLRVWVEQVDRWIELVEVRMQSIKLLLEEIKNRMEEQK